MNWLNVLMLFGPALASADCIVIANGVKFDFTSLDGKQISYLTEVQWLIQFTFCQDQVCSENPGSICQIGPDGDKNMLGKWDCAKNVEGSPGQLKMLLDGGDSAWCPQPRASNVTFKCVNGPARITNYSEEGICQYGITIEVPNAVCASWAPPCCTPPTFSATRVENDGSMSVVQADGSRGLWFDQNYQASGASTLCLQGYDRCFKYTPTICIGSEFTPAPRTCYGNSTFEFVKDTWVGETSIKQVVWYSKPESSYVVTMPVPFGQTSSCLPVSGNKANSLIEVSASPNATWWEIPKTCLKFLKTKPVHSM